MRKISLTLLLLAILVACSSTPDGLPENPENLEQGVVIENCDGLTGSYQTAGPRPLEQAPPGEPFATWLLAFTMDGTVLWKYSTEVSSGSFTCQNNLISASFPEGTRTTFEGTFDPKNLQVKIEDLIYYKATEE
jgi:hypothetical protein